LKLGVIALNLMNFEFEAGLDYAQRLGLQAIEVGGLGLWPRKYCDPDRLLRDKGEVERWLDAFASRNLQISALGGHGAPLSPDKKAAAEYSRQFRQACKLAELAGIKRMTLLAGLPEGAEGDTAPNWVTFVEFPFLRDTLAWQWEKRLLPYWREHGKIARDHGLTLCFEMHGGDLVYNPVTFMRLRDEIGPVAACNFDTSQMWFQGIDPVEALFVLGSSVKHVHAKDTVIHDPLARTRGLMDSTSMEQPGNRAWSYTIPGWGHGEMDWRNIVTALQLIGYDHVLSLEMECEFMELHEGLEKAVAFLSPIVLKQPTTKKWWEVAELERAGSLDCTDD
jgi:sugar phosphate isomerase/epimerase